MIVVIPPSMLYMYIISHEHRYRCVADLSNPRSAQAVPPAFSASPGPNDRNKPQHQKHQNSAIQKKKKPGDNNNKNRKKPIAKERKKCKTPKHADTQAATPPTPPSTQAATYKKGKSKSDLIYKSTHHHHNKPRPSPSTPHLRLSICLCTPCVKARPNPSITYSQPLSSLLHI